MARRELVAAVAGAWVEGKAQGDENDTTGPMMTGVRDRRGVWR